MNERGIDRLEPVDHDAMLDLIVELAARVTAVEKRQARRLAAEEALRELRAARAARSVVEAIVDTQP